MPRPSRIAFITLGCPKNEVDTRHMQAAVLGAGYVLAAEPQEADVIVVNTCSFIEEATEESIGVVLEATGLRTGESGPRVVVTGCMPSRYGTDLEEALPEVDAFVPVADEPRLVAVLDRLTGGATLADAKPAGPTPETLARETHAAASAAMESGPYAYLQVSDGCDRACAYCTIPAIRGPYRSRPLHEMVEEAEALVRAGARELVLIGQDTSSYGIDLAEDLSLSDVLRAVAAVPGADRIRLMYVQPDGVTDELLHTIAETPNVCHYLDMPLQHASASVLQRMHRAGNGATFLALVDRIREIVPDCVLRTTVIAGFPGETRQDAAELARFLQQAAFDYVGVFPFSPEEGTEAVGLPEQVPARTRRARAQRLRDLADQIGAEKAASRVGDVLDVLIEGIDEEDGVVFGRWCGQAPEIDGIVLLDGGRPGEIVRARIVDSLGYDLEGELE